MTKTRYYRLVEVSCVEFHICLSNRLWHTRESSFMASCKPHFIADQCFLIIEITRQVTAEVLDVKFEKNISPADRC
jgi:hypothetical protein